MIFFGLLGLAVGLGLPIAVIGGGIGQGLAAAGALQGMARQPEALGKIQTAMILALAFIESLVIFALVFIFILNGKVPTISSADATAALQATSHSTTAPNGSGG